MGWGTGRGGAPTRRDSRGSGEESEEAAAFLLKDVSASMGPGQHFLADTVFWAFEEELYERYRDVETAYGLFGSDPVFVGQETFYGPHQGRGGCGAAEGLELVRDRAAPGAEDTYLVMAGDGHYATDELYGRLHPVEPDAAAHVCVYAGQDEGVASFRVDLDERWSYDGVVTGPGDLETVHSALESLVDGVVER